VFENKDSLAPGVYYNAIDGECPYGGGKENDTCYIGKTRLDTIYRIDKGVTTPGVYYNPISGGCPRGGSLVGNQCRLIELGMPLIIPTSVGLDYIWIDLNPKWSGVYYKKVDGKCSSVDISSDPNCRITELDPLTEYIKGESSIHYAAIGNRCTKGGRLINGNCDVVAVLPFDFETSVSIQSVSSNGWLDGRSNDHHEALLSDPGRSPTSDPFLQWKCTRVKGKKT
jgi:hypothetical protein